MITNQNKSELPLALGISLVENAEALSYYARLSAAKRREIAEKSRYIDTKQEMQSYVSQLRRWE
jgi:hypothetical protein